MAGQWIDWTYMPDAAGDSGGVQWRVDLLDNGTIKLTSGARELVLPRDVVEHLFHVYERERARRGAC